MVGLRGWTARKKDDITNAIDGYTTLRALGVFKDWSKLWRAAKQ